MKREPAPRDDSFQPVGVEETRLCPFPNPPGNHRLLTCPYVIRQQAIDCFHQVSTAGSCDTQPKRRGKQFRRVLLTWHCRFAI
jgi:hypothetical protein